MLNLVCNERAMTDGLGHDMSRTFLRQNVKNDCVWELRDFMYKNK
jgi:hypothetical protein